MLRGSPTAAADPAQDPPSVDGSQAPTCSNYCHGSSFTTGSNHAPSWTTVNGSQDACGTCHGVPPASPHPQNKSCGSCHGSCYSETTVDPTKHVNGQLDVGNMTCTSCHGATKLVPNLDFSTKDTAFATLVNVDASTGGACGGKGKLVTPNNCETSILYSKLTQTTPVCGRPLTRW